MTQNQSTTSDNSQFSLTDFYDEAEINGNGTSDDTLNTLEQAAEPPVYIYLSELFGELDFTDNNSSVFNPEDSIESGVLLPEDLLGSPDSLPEDEARMSYYAHLEDSVVIPDF